MSTPKLFLNLVLFQMAWWLCILSAAWEIPLAALGGSVVLMGAQFAFTSLNRRRDAWLVAAVMTIGGVSDTALALAGFVAFSSPWPVEWIASLSELLLWGHFALVMNGCMGFLLGRPLWAALFGMLGGPMAYLGGMQLGAVTLAAPTWLSLVAIGITWGAVLPLVYELSVRLDRTPEPPPVAT
jgi:hypothetical protein